MFPGSTSGDAYVLWDGTAEDGPLITVTNPDIRAIQMAKAAGARVVVTAGSQDKCDRCVALGADVAVNYREGDFTEAAKAATEKPYTDEACVEPEDETIGVEEPAGEPEEAATADDELVETVIVEGLANLDQLPTRFTFIGFPLNFKGGNGSPIRAVASVD